MRKVGAGNESASFLPNSKWRKHTNNKVKIFHEVARFYPCNITVLISFFVTEANKKVLIHKKTSRFPLSCTAHSDFEIFKKAVFEFCGVQSLAEVKGVGRNIDCSFMRTIRSPETVESFCIRTQRQWENKVAFLLERESILQGMFDVL